MPIHAIPIVRSALANRTTALSTSFPEKPETLDESIDYWLNDRRLEPVCPAGRVRTGARPGPMAPL